MGQGLVVQPRAALHVGQEGHMVRPPQPDADREQRVQRPRRIVAAPASGAPARPTAHPSRTAARPDQNGMACSSANCRTAAAWLRTPVGSSRSWSSTQAKSRACARLARWRSASASASDCRICASRLVRVAEDEEGAGQQVPRHHPLVVGVVQREPAMLRGIVERQRPLEMPPRRSEPAEPPRAVAEACARPSGGGRCRRIVSRAAGTPAPSDGRPPDCRRCGGR